MLAKVRGPGAFEQQHARPTHTHARARTDDSHNRRVYASVTVRFLCHLLVPFPLLGQDRDKPPPPPHPHLLALALARLWRRDPDAPRKSAGHKAAIQLLLQREREGGRAAPPHHPPNMGWTIAQWASLYVCVCFSITPLVLGGWGRGGCLCFSSPSQQQQTKRHKGHTRSASPPTFLLPSPPPLPPAAAPPALHSTHAQEG